MFSKSLWFDGFFSKKFSTIVSNNFLATNLTSKAENIISTFDFRTSDIIKFMEALKLNKAHGNDEISIYMIKLCVFSVSKLLHILWKNCSRKEYFANELKKTKIVPAYKKVVNQLISTYQPVLFLPICA